MRSHTEYVAWLHLHHGADHHALDADLWPRGEVKSQTRDAVTSRVRIWLGAEHFPPVTNGAYALHPSVRSDWDEFQDHYRTGLSATGADSDTALRQALRLVRSSPSPTSIRTGTRGPRRTPKR
jgi:uncharacterized protein YeaO (DUF488 family)